MGKIIRNGINYSSTTDAAKNINYDNSQSGLNATTAQKAIDELNEKIAAGGGGSSSNIVYLTQAEYDALPEDKLEDNIEYWITDAGVRGSAENVSYDASASGLDAKNVQEAVDKLAEGAGNKVEYLTQEEYDALPEDKLTNDVEYRILDSGTPTTACNVGYDGSASGIDAVNVQGAIDKVNGDLGVFTIQLKAFMNALGYDPSFSPIYKEYLKTKSATSSSAIVTLEKLNNINEVTESIDINQTEIANTTGRDYELINISYTNATWFITALKDIYYSEKIDIPYSNRTLLKTGEQLSWAYNITKEYYFAEA